MARQRSIVPRARLERRRHPLRQRGRPRRGARPARTTSIRRDGRSSRTGPIAASPASIAISDGRIARSEWFYAREGFIRADRNRDDVLTRAEFLGFDVDSDREDRFDYLDANNNGRVERSEWHGSRDAFEWLDRNNDGVAQPDGSRRRRRRAARSLRQPRRQQ